MDNVNQPDGQRTTLRPPASFSLQPRAFLSDVEAPPLSQFNPIFLIGLAGFSSRPKGRPRPALSPPAAFSPQPRAFLSDVEAPPLSQFNPIFLIGLAEFSSRSKDSP